ncbi:MAG: hypothetical protein WCK93_01180 [Nitrosomonadales bacterium]
MMQSGLLFSDETPVTEKEVSDWLDTIPNLSATESRRQTYRKNYNVDEKIRNEKRLKVSQASPKRKAR